MKHGMCWFWIYSIHSTQSSAEELSARVLDQAHIGSRLKVKIAFTRQTSVVFWETQCKLRFPANRYRVPGFKSGTIIGFKPAASDGPSKMDRSKSGCASRNVRESGMYMKAPGFEFPSRLHSLRIKFTEYLGAAVGKNINKFLDSWALLAKILSKSWLYQTCPFLN